MKKLTKPLVSLLAAVFIAMSLVGPASANGASANTSTNPACTTTGNVVPDGDFSQGTAYFWYRFSFLATYTSTGDWIGFNGPPFGVFLNAPVFDDVRWRNYIAVCPHSQYRLEGYIKPTNVVPQNQSPYNACASIGVERFDLAVDDLHNDWQHTPALCGTKYNFQHVATPVCTGDATTLYVDARLGWFSYPATGYAEYRNITMRRTGRGC